MERTSSEKRCAEQILGGNRFKEIEIHTFRKKSADERLYPEKSKFRDETQPIPLFSKEESFLVRPTIDGSQKPLTPAMLSPKGKFPHFTNSNKSKQIKGQQYDPKEFNLKSTFVNQNLNQNQKITQQKTQDMALNHHTRDIHSKCEQNFKPNADIIDMTDNSALISKNGIAYQPNLAENFEDVRREIISNPDSTRNVRNCFEDYCQMQEDKFVFYYDEQSNDRSETGGSIGNCPEEEYHNAQFNPPLVVQNLENLSFSGKPKNDGSKSLSDPKTEIPKNKNTNRQNAVSLRKKKKLKVSKRKAISKRQAFLNQIMTTHNLGEETSTPISQPSKLEFNLERGNTSSPSILETTETLSPISPPPAQEPRLRTLDSSPKKSLAQKLKLSQRKRSQFKSRFWRPSDLISKNTSQGIKSQFSVRREVSRSSKFQKSLKQRSHNNSGFKSFGDNSLAFGSRPNNFPRSQGLYGQCFGRSKTSTKKNSVPLSQGSSSLKPVCKRLNLPSLEQQLSSIQSAGSESVRDSHQFKPNKYLSEQIRPVSKPQNQDSKDSKRKMFKGSRLNNSNQGKKTKAKSRQKQKHRPMQDLISRSNRERAIPIPDSKNAFNKLLKRRFFKSGRPKKASKSFLASKNKHSLLGMSRKRSVNDSKHSLVFSSQNGLSLRALMSAELQSELRSFKKPSKIISKNGKRSDTGERQAGYLSRRGFNSVNNPNFFHVNGAQIRARPRFSKKDSGAKIFLRNKKKSTRNQIQTSSSLCCIHVLTNLINQLIITLHNIEI